MRRLPAILGLVVGAPTVFGPLVAEVVSDVGWFDGHKTRVVAFAGAVVVLLFGIRDSWDLFYWPADEPKDSTIYVPNVLLYYLVVGINVAVGYALSWILAIQPPWPAAILGIATFVWIRMGLSAVHPVPVMGRRILQRSMASFRARIVLMQHRRNERDGK